MTNMTTWISHHRSTPGMDRVVLMSLIFATSTLLSSQANVIPCQDNPDFLWKREIDCDWIKSWNKKDRLELCATKVRRKTVMIKEECPDACGLCENGEYIEKKKHCPKASNDAGGFCDNFESGLTCCYNHEYTGGCGPNDPIRCSAIDIYTCDDDSRWRHKSIDRAINDCINPNPNVPMTCEPCPEVEPKDICPASKPIPGGECFVDEVECRYDFKYTGCNPEELRCVPEVEFFCNNGRWIEVVTIPDQLVCPPTNKVLQR